MRSTLKTAFPIGELDLRPMARNSDKPPRKNPRSNRGPSTDSLDMHLLKERRDSVTQVHTTESPGNLEVEVNLILIAHPENLGLGNRFQLAHGGLLEIGRSPTLQISLPDVLSVSRNHARVDYSGTSVVVEDLGSTNGTYVNDEKIEGRQVLRSGDRIQVGAVHFKYLHERDVEAAYHEAIYNLMMRDGLTGTYNQRKFEEELQREVTRARRYQRPLSLILLDLDLFKSVNDSHGHLCGDSVLKQMAGLIEDLLRSEQVLARVGGEEFAVLCPEADAPGGVQLAERLREAVEEKTFHYGSIALSLTCSFGVAGVSASIRRPKDLFEAADRALYRSKKEGRNLVYLAESCGRPWPISEGADSGAISSRMATALERSDAGRADLESCSSRISARLSSRHAGTNLLDRHADAGSPRSSGPVDDPEAGDSSSRWIDLGSSPERHGFQLGGGDRRPGQSPFLSRWGSRG
jgi:two-component system cell cycle response regulator